MKRDGYDYWFVCCLSRKGCITGTANPRPCNITKQILKGESAKGTQGILLYTTSATDGKLAVETEAEAEAEQEHTDSLGHGSAS